MQDFFFTIAPFAEYLFMQKALASVVIISFGSAIMGVFLQIKRLSLMGDALAHAMLPGVAISFLFFGYSLFAMIVGGIFAGIMVVIITSYISKISMQKEDAIFGVFYTLAIALGVLIISAANLKQELSHILFGSILSINNSSLIFSAAITSLILLFFAIFYRSIVIESVDNIYFRSIGKNGKFYHNIFLILIVLQMISAFQTIGTMMAIGMMLIPAATSKFWFENLAGIIASAVIFAVFGSVFGLLISFNYDIPSGASIILFCGMIYLLSFIIGRYNSIKSKYFNKKHLVG